MDNKIDDKFILQATRELINTLGVKQPIREVEIIEDVSLGKIQKAIEQIANYLGLPVRINISFVPKGYNPSRKSGFESSQLSRTDSQGRGLNAIVAQVSIPKNMPLYGTRELDNFPINVVIGEDFKEEPMAFMAIMAHELSHLVLYSLWHKEKENEFYTDLTAMVLGFNEVMAKGRKVVTETRTGNVVQTLTTTYGYLSDKQFELAQGEICGVLETATTLANQHSKNVRRCKSQMSSFIKNCSRFNRFLDYVDRNSSQKFKPADMQEIVRFHSGQYCEDLQSTLNFFWNKTNELDGKFSDLNHFTSELLKLLEDQIRVMDTLSYEMKMRNKLLQQDLKVLCRYVSLFFRIKTQLNLIRA